MRYSRVKSTNRNTINQFRNVLVELMDDISFNNRINEIIKNNHEINNKKQELKNGFKDIQLEHMQGLELAGECDLCKRIQQINK